MLSFNTDTDVYKKDGSIWLDVHAGNDGKGTILYTAAHELTHFIQQWSSAKYEIFTDFLLENYAEKGKSIDDLVAAQIEKAALHGEELTYDEAFDEVIADSCEAMLADGDVMTKIAELKERDKGLWEKIVEYITALVDKIKAIYKELSPDSAEGKFVAEQLDTFEELKKLWTEALVEASENFAAGTTAQKNTAERGVKNSLKNDAIDLSDNSELRQSLIGIKGAQKYKIIQAYILESLSGQPIILSDGKKAIVDKSDALHIANKSTPRKTAQIAKIKSLVENAELYAEDVDTKHNKFDYFCYYKANVAYNGDVFPVFLNVGRGINDRKYHLYDVTEKIRDTANRINGFERPKPNEGYAQENGISTPIIRDTDASVKRKNSFKDVDPAKYTPEQRALLAGLISQGRDDAQKARAKEEQFEKKIRAKEFRNEKSTESYSVLYFSPNYLLCFHKHQWENGR